MRNNKKEYKDQKRKQKKETKKRKQDEESIKKEKRKKEVGFTPNREATQEVIDDISFGNGAITKLEKRRVGMSVGTVFSKSRLKTMVFTAHANTIDDTELLNTDVIY